MTVIATCLAGLASSEMTRAQYDRSWAAQLQSKASDEWGYFQAKRLRSLLQGDSLDLIQELAPLDPGDDATLAATLQKQLGGPPPPPARQRAWTQAKALVDSPAGQKAADAPEKAHSQSEAKAAAIDPRLTAAFRAIEQNRSDSEIFAAQAGISDPELEQAFQAAQSRLQAFDGTVKPPTAWADPVAAAWSRAGLRAPPLLRQLRLHYDNLRYDAESRLDQQIAYFYELKVRRANVTADRHRSRSQQFFFGMLGAQAAVGIALYVNLFV